MRARHAVIHEAARQHLPVGIVKADLVEHLPEALHQSAVNLRLGERVVDDVASVVDAHIGHQLGFPRRRVDLDFRHMRAGWKRPRRRHPEHGVERIVAVLGRFPREIEQRDREVGALDAVAAVGEFDVLGAGLQMRRGEVAALLHDFARRQKQRAAVRHQRTRADGAVAHQRRAVGVGIAQRDFLRRDAEFAPDDFRKHGLVALSRGAGNRVDDGVSGVAELDEGFLARRRAAARRLDEDAARAAQ